jgi:hypothetical protein
LICPESVWICLVLPEVLMMTEMIMFSAPPERSEADVSRYILDL